MEGGTPVNFTKVILFTSCKGGVGKSTVCANIAMSLATKNKKVLLIDCDFGSRCLDIISGIENSSIYDVGDVVLGRVGIDKAVVIDKRNKNLSFLSAIINPEMSIDVSSFKKMIGNLVRSGMYDFIFIDTPGGIGQPLKYACSVSEWAFIITNQTTASIRAADRTADFLYSNGVHNLRLIINKMTSDNIKEAKNEIISIIDEASVKLIGVIPYDKEIIKCGNKGVLVDGMKSKLAIQAFDNVAERVLGHQCLLFHNIKKINKLK